MKSFVVTPKSNEIKDVEEEDRTIKVWLFEDVPEKYREELLKVQEEKCIDTFEWIAFIPNKIHEEVGPIWSYCIHFGSNTILTRYLEKGILRISCKIEI
jgi:hypothetical protein